MGRDGCKVSEQSVAKRLKRARWGNPPWRIDFRPKKRALPEAVDFAIVGGGFTGLAAAAWLKHVAPKKSVALFEAEKIGAGSSGHTGGLVLPETAAGDMPGLGDVLSGLSETLRALRVKCDLKLPGVWEIGREKGREDSPISWSDSGTLRVTREIAGGTLDPGKMVSGLARAASRGGALIFEHARVEDIAKTQHTELKIAGKRVRARCVLLSTNAHSLELSELAGQAQPKFTLAVMTGPLTKTQLKAIGLGAGKPFYTVDLPYLWGRLARGNRVIFGSGLVHLQDWRELMNIDVKKGEAAELLKGLESRIHGFHPVLGKVSLTHRWGGPILIADKWQPVFMRHPENQDAIVLGAYSGHGVALSVYLGRWAAEAMLGKRDLPEWSIAKTAAN
jgi:glycine/D-amino acid oxidase-like deaminating enzyme